MSNTEYEISYFIRYLICQLRYLTCHMRNLICGWNLAESQSFAVRLLSENCTIFHASKTWLHARVLMSVYCQTVVQFTMHQRPGSRQDFDVRHLSDSCIILMHKDLAKATGLIKIRCPWNLALRWKNKVSKKLKILSEFCCTKYQTNVLKISWVRI